MKMYRVSAKAIDSKECFIYEMFDSLNGAEAYRDNIEDDDRDVLSGLPFNHIVVTTEMLCEGTWVTLTSRLVRI